MGYPLLPKVIKGKNCTSYPRLPLVTQGSSEFPKYCIFLKPFKQFLSLLRACMQFHQVLSFWAAHKNFAVLFGSVRSPRNTNLRSCVCLFVESLSRALNLHLKAVWVSPRSVSGQSQVSLRSVLVSGQSQVSLRSVPGQSQVSLRSLLGLS